MKTLKESIDEHFEKYPRCVDNHIWGLLKFMRQGNDAQDKYYHERSDDFLRGYEAAIKTVVDIIKYNAEHWPHEISKEYAGRMIVGMLHKMHTNDYFVNSKLYDEFDKYANIDYKPKYVKSNIFTSLYDANLPHSTNKVIMIIDLNYKMHEYEYVEFDVCDCLETCKGMSYKKMNFKEFDDMIALNRYYECVDTTISQ